MGRYLRLNLSKFVEDAQWCCPENPRGQRQTGPDWPQRTGTSPLRTHANDKLITTRK